MEAGPEGQDAKPAKKNNFLFSPNLASFAALRSPCGVLALVETIQLGRAVTPQGEPRGVSPWGAYLACVEINTPQGESLSPFKSLDPVIVRNRQVFVCRRIPTNKKVILCTSAVNPYLRKSAVSTPSPNLAPFAPLRESSPLSWLYA